MRNMRWGRPAVGLVLGAATLLALGCGGEKLASRWRDRPLTVDGSSVEWEGAVQYLPDQKISVGAMNDADDLYLTFSTADRRTAAQVLFRGFTVWLDPEKGDRLGIHFPLGRPGHDRRGDAAGGGNDADRDGDEGYRGRGGPGERFGPDENPDLERLVIPYRGPDAEMEILGRGDPRRLPVSQADGIQVSIDSVNGVLVYELRVPLHDSEGKPGLAVGPGGTIGVQLKTPEAKFEGVRPPRMGGDWDSGSGEPDGGFTGRPSGGRPGGMGQGMTPGSAGDTPGPLNASFKLYLATAP